MPTSPGRGQPQFQVARKWSSVRDARALPMIDATLHPRLASWICKDRGRSRGPTPPRSGRRPCGAVPAESRISARRRTRGCPAAEHRGMKIIERFYWVVLHNRIPVRDSMDPPSSSERWRRGRGLRQDAAGHGPSGQHDDGSQSMTAVGSSRFPLGSVRFGWRRRQQHRAFSMAQQGCNMRAHFHFREVNRCRCPGPSGPKNPRPGTP